MSTNPLREYAENFRANLPQGVTYDSTIARYFYNGKRFNNEWEVGRYRLYILKFGSIPANAIQQRDGSYILDRAGNYIETR